MIHNNHNPLKHTYKKIEIRFDRVVKYDFSQSFKFKYRRICGKESDRFWYKTCLGEDKFFVKAWRFKS